MKSYNEDFYRLFSEIADLMAIKNENSFKIRAYRGAAMRLKEDFRLITKKDADKKILMAIPKIGEAIAEKMIQFMKEGKIDYLERLRKEIPKPVRDLLNIPHLGPNRVRDLYINLGIKSKADLKRLAKSGQIADLPGFGDKLVQSIMDALNKGQEKKKRHNRSEVDPFAQKIIKLIKGIKEVKSAEAAGSYRRGAKTVGDLDILVVGRQHIASDIKQMIQETYKNITVLASGETKIAFVLFPENLQIDIRFVPEESYGAALLYFTGSKDFNVMMRKKAIEKGYLLNEYGLFENGEHIAGHSEDEVFDKLDLPHTPPIKRK